MLIFEQHFYLRQPGYGSSYISGKYLIKEALADYAKKMENEGKAFKVKDFFDQMNAIGNIPVSLGHWQLTGNDGEINTIRDRN